MNEVVLRKLDPMIRDFVISIAVVVSFCPSAAQAQDRCAGARDLRLVNGKIVTLDTRNQIVSEVTIQDGRFATVGKAGRTTPCMKTIDLGGRTAVPGLIDNHNHIVQEEQKLGTIE